MAETYVDTGYPKCRLLEGTPKYARAPVGSATIIKEGMLVCISSGSAIPVDDVTWNTNEATTKTDAFALFAGVAHESSASGETNEILIGYDAVYRFPFDETVAAALVTGSAITFGKQYNLSLLSSEAINEDAGTEGTNEIGILVKAAAIGDTFGNLLIQSQIFA